MTRYAFGEWNRKQLRWLLVLFFIALLVPTAILSWQAFSRLEWESFHQHQQFAEELVNRMDRQLAELIAREEARSFADYSFLVVEGEPAVNYLQRSPLSKYPVDNEFPGLLGYFQIDAEGKFTTPLLPDDENISPLTYGISRAELKQRRELTDRLLRLLRLEQREIAGNAMEDAEAQRVDSDGMARDSEESREQTLSQDFFDHLAKEATVPDRKKAAGSIGRVEELKLEQVDVMAPQARQEIEAGISLQSDRVSRKERSALPAPSIRFQAADSANDEPAASQEESVRSAPIRFFESEIDPFEFSLLPSGHFVLFRKVWRDGQRHIQGALLEPQPLLSKLLEEPFRGSVLSSMSRLAVAYEGDILSAYGGAERGRYLNSTDELAGTLLFRNRLTAPLGAMEAILTVTRMPTGTGSFLLTWTVLILGLVLGGGLLLFYRLGLKQIELYRQQRDFVSAVSHELKTPLTSIRMYSEMLREGWADEDKKRDYYNFIHDESERLSRLIVNVLQLARMSRNGLQLQPRNLAVSQLMDAVRSKVIGQAERAGFELQLNCDDATGESSIEVDEDAFIQIVINLVDNAIKFSANAEVKRIEIGCQQLINDKVEFSIRDHGPGIPRDQLKKIFKLFYRSEDELTRETVGTGIGLALVHRLVTSMNGSIDVVSSDPGAKFRLFFPIQPSDT